MKRKLVIIVAAVTVIAAAAWWFASPWWTLRQMRDAAADRDSARLSAYVDYPALRADVKEELRGAIAAQSAQDSTAVGGAAGSAIALAMIGPMIDAIVSPQGVEAMLTRQTAAQGTGNAGGGEKAAEKPIVERDGFNRFRLREADPRKGAMVFERSGLGWKLTGVDLPR